MRLLRKDLPAPQGFHAWRGAALSLTSGAVVTFESVTFGAALYNPSTGQFMPREEGIYQLLWMVGAGAALTADNYWIANLYKNGVLHRSGLTMFQRGSAVNVDTSGQATVRAVPGDYFEVRLSTNNGSTALAVGVESATWFSGARVG